MLTLSGLTWGVCPFLTLPASFKSIRARVREPVIPSLDEGLGNVVGNRVGKYLFVWSSGRLWGQGTEHWANGWSPRREHPGLGEGSQQRQGPAAVQTPRPPPMTELTS